MKRIVASQSSSEELVLTSAGLLELLLNIDEFKDFDFGLVESLDNNLQLQVNDSYYTIQPENTSENVEIDEDSLNQISQINDESYQELLDNDQVSEQEPIESGLIKELVKTLAIGGLVRLGKSLITK